jgi:2-methylcitrate dehydratase PrpD
LYGVDSGTRAEHSSVPFVDALEYWRAEWDTDWGIKRYPACYATHRAADAALRLRAAHDVSSARGVTVTVHPEGLRPLRTGLPQTSNEAKFTMAFVIATALLSGELRLRDFDAESLSNPAVVDLMTRITVAESDIPPLGPPEFDGGFAVVSLEMADGQIVRERADVTHGDSRSPLTDSELTAKFLDCCSDSDLSLPQAETLHRILESFFGAQSGFTQLHNALSTPGEFGGNKP